MRVHGDDFHDCSCAQIDPVQHLDSLLPLVDLLSIEDDILFNFMSENNAMVANHQGR